MGAARRKPREVEIAIRGPSGHVLKGTLSSDDPLEIWLFLRYRREAMRLGEVKAKARLFRRELMLSAIRLRSRRSISDDERRKAGTILIALLSCPDAMKAIEKYLSPKQAPLGRLVAEDYATQRALGNKAAVANKLIQDAWRLSEKQVTDHWTNWRKEAEKSVDPKLKRFLLEGYARELRTPNSVARRLVGESYEAWSRKRNKVKFRPKAGTRNKK